ncbi:SOS response-associated peptidase family protein [Acidithiobacillus ferridurans]|jgi:putative SOS response-associated peptidase YedK|uniref:SOS response-associated peptidase family protein n=1 Tax=Acidithiobacillus ferridurans TaxID=1232575 RepID=UPI00384BED47
MCGRYSLHSPIRQVLRHFGMPVETMAAGFLPRYNIAPGTPVPLVLHKWGDLVPGGRHVLERYIIEAAATAYPAAGFILPPPLR